MAIDSLTDIKDFRTEKSINRQKNFKAGCIAGIVLSAVAGLILARYRTAPTPENVLRKLNSSPTIEYKVKPGDNLWNFAINEGIDGECQRDVYINWVRKRNNMLGAQELMPGQKLMLPDFNKNGIVGSGYKKISVLNKDGTETIIYEDK